MSQEAESKRLRAQNTVLEGLCRKLRSRGAESDVSAVDTVTADRVGYLSPPTPDSCRESVER